MHVQGAELHKVLGLTAAGLPAAATQPLALTATFFAGPLLFRLLDPATCRAASSVLEAGQNMLRIALQPGQWSRAAAALSQQALGDESLVLWRNLVVAPVAEEFVFRACMAPLLLLKVCVAAGVQAYSVSSEPVCLALVCVCAVRARAARSGDGMVALAKHLLLQPLLLVNLMCQVARGADSRGARHEEATTASRRAEALGWVHTNCHKVHPSGCRSLLVKACIPLSFLLGGHCCSVYQGDGSLGEQGMIGVSKEW